jgi:peptidoglycan/xylan/chitin deacetylase (PgdA/CDA1 family)
MIYWSLDPEDWKLLNADKVSAYVLERIQPGDIVLLHDFYPTSVEAALRIIDVLQKEGYAFVTVSELFDIYGTVPEAGKLYKNATQERNW